MPLHFSSPSYATVSQLKEKLNQKQKEILDLTAKLHETTIKPPGENKKMRSMQNELDDKNEEMDCLKCYKGIGRGRGVLDPNISEMLGASMPPRGRGVSLHISPSPSEDLEDRPPWGQITDPVPQGASPAQPRLRNLEFGPGRRDLECYNVRCRRRFMDLESQLNQC